VIVARGGEDARAAAERALEGGDPSLALRYAKELLARIPRSPIGLVLAADAAEASFLDDEAATYLAELAEVVPWQPEIWLRLGLARQRAGKEPSEVREALSHAAGEQSAPRVATAAAVALADIDLELGDATRALVWLDRVRDATDVNVLERRAMALLELGDVEGARQAAATLDVPGALEGRRALLFGRLLAHAGGDATPYLLRAYILEQKGAARALSTYIASAGPRAAEAVREVIDALGELDAPLFRAAFAQARGDRHGSLEALAAAAAQGDAEAARALASLALELRDAAALRRAHEALSVAGLSFSEIERAIVLASGLLDEGRAGEALDALDGAGEQPWAVELRAAAVGSWAPEGGMANVPAVLGEIRRAARELDDARALLATEALAVEAERPLRVAVMGEFNAGKSTFVNALVGADIAPTGVLPTTATLHHVVFSPDPFARIIVEGGPERVVSPERLRGALDEVHRSGAAVTRVTVGLPLERLRHIELIDTPGFNAPNIAHAASAREALAEVHLSLWLLDASQAWKETERVVLAEVKAQGVPVQFIVNKLDRIQEAERPAVLAYVREKLGETGLASIAPIVCASSRLALAGRLGDADALERSGWAAIEAMVEQVVVGRAAQLKDAALRRRARQLIAPMLERGHELAAAEVAAARADAQRRAALVQGAAKLARETNAAVRAAARALDAPRRALTDDLAPLGEGDAAAPASRSYAAHRAVQRLALPLAQALLSIALPEDEHPGEALEAARPAAAAALHGLVLGLARPVDIVTLPAERLVEAVSPPVIVALQSATSRWNPPARAAAPLALRLQALSAALAGSAP
jgi:cellulose synthase operon protein C